MKKLGFNSEQYDIDIIFKKIKEYFEVTPTITDKEFINIVSNYKKAVNFC